MTSLHRIILFFLCFVAVALPSLGRAQSNPPAWSATTHYAVGDLVSAYGNTYRCIHSVQATGLDPSRAYGFWELNFARVNTRLLIGVKQPFPTLVSAWNYILNARIADGATVTLEISTFYGLFNETFNQPFSLDHAYGARIAITADVLDTNTLTFSGGTDGFTVDTNHTIGSLSNLSMYGVVGATNVAGVRVTTGASVGSLSTCWIQNFETSVVASVNGNATVSGCYLQSYNVAGCWATTGGTLNFPSGVYLGITPAGTNYTVGLYATVGGHITAHKSTLQNLPYGAEARTGGIIDLAYSTISNCSISCYATTRGFLDCTGSTITNSSVWDLDADFGGIINAALLPNASNSTGTNDGSYIYL